MLRQYGLSLSGLAQTIRRQNVDLPTGSIKASDGEILLRFSDERHSINRLRDLIVVTSTDGGQIRLGDIASIVDQFEKDEVQITFNGRPAALLDITKSANQDTIKISQRIETFLNQERQRAPEGVSFTVVNNISSLVNDRA